MTIKKYDEDVPLLENKKVNGKYFKLAFYSPNLSKNIKPGQFLHVRVNQGQQGGRWNLLGTFDFEAGSHVVDVHNGGSAPGAVVSADAVRFVPAGSAITR